MITYNYDKDFALPLIFPEEAEVVGLQHAGDGSTLWRYVGELREKEDGSIVMDVPAGAFGQSAGRLLPLWQAAPAGGGQAWDSRNSWSGWAPSTAVLSRGHELQVRLDRQSNGRYRADMQYATRANGRTMTLSPDCAVVAMRCRLPKDAVVTWDVVTWDGSTANTKDYASQIPMPDGSTLLLCDLREAAQAGAMPVFQVKIADIPAASVSSMTTPSYYVWWFRAFASEADARAFMNAQAAQPAEFALHSRVYIGGGHLRRGAAERAELAAARAELEQVRGDLESTASELESTAEELEAARAELAAVDPAAIIDGAVRSGRAAVEFALANFEYDTYWGYRYGRWEKGALEKNLEISGPWISPAFALPSPDGDGHPPSLATFFGGSSNLFYSAPIALGECTNLHQAWQSCPMLREAPHLDTSKVKNFAGCFYGSTLKDFPDWDYGSAENLSGFFQTNKVIEETSAIHLPKATNLKQVLWACPKLRRIGPIYAPKAKDIRIANISDDSSLGLERIDEIDYGSATTNAILHYLHMATNLRFARFINIGKSAFTDYRLGFPNWGDGSDENRQSLIDSLITCSHDRAAAGMPVATLALHRHTIARLTEEEIAEITAKGFTITEATTDRVDY